jgi:hypothetical protein
VAYDDCPTAVDVFCRREEVTTSVGVVGKVVFYDLEKPEPIDFPDIPL